MPERGTYMGPRLRRLRRELGLTQGGMAADLGVSVSYVSLIESNQRPVTTDLLLRLARTYKIDLSDLAGDGGAEFTTRLQASLRDPLFADIDLPSLQTADVATGFPGITEAFLRLHTAYLQEQMALADREAGAAGHFDIKADPIGEVRRFLTARRNHFPQLETAAKQIAAAVDELGGLSQYLHSRHGLKVWAMPSKSLNFMVRRHDPHRSSVFLAEGLDGAERSFQLALQIAYIDLRETLDSLVHASNFGSQNAERLARRVLASYAAGSILMPYERFARAAVEKLYDVEALARQFGANFEQVAHRLTTLQRPGEELVPFFLIKIDAAGNVFHRLDPVGVRFASHAGGCSLWSLHDVFNAPGRVLTQRLETPDGEQFISIARTIHRGGGAYRALEVQRGLALVCSSEHASKLVYARTNAELVPTPIGSTCSLCHRYDCPARSAPPLGRQILPDDYHRPLAPFGYSDD